MVTSLNSLVISFWLASCCSAPEQMERVTPLHRIVEPVAAERTLADVLEEDDEFEEFEQEHWGAAEEDASNAKQWQDNWDDDDIEDDFTKSLRAELAKGS